MNNNLFKKSLIALTVILSVSLHADEDAKCCKGKAISKNTFLPRAFSSHSSREILLRESMYMNPEREAWNGTFTTAVEFSQNFGGCNDCKNLGTMPFWSGSNTMTFGTNDGTSDLDAYQFGMGNIASQGQIKLDPKVQQAGADLMLHFMQYLDRPGFYFKIKAPLGAMMIDPRVSLLVDVGPDASTSLPTQYSAPNDRPQNLLEAFHGGRATADLDGAFSKPIRLEYGKINMCRESAIRLADLSVSFGANVVKSEKAMLGVGFKMAAPTGNTPKAVEMLEPIFGRGGCWAVGAELFGHYNAYQGDAWNATLHWQGELLHLAHGRTGYRSFDLKKNGPGSKYLLLQYYHQQSTGAYSNSGTFVTQAINVTTLPVKSKFNVEGNFAFMVDAQKDNWHVGLGAEVWGRSCEKLEVDCCKAVKALETGTLNNFAVLGRQLGAGTGTLCEPLAKIGESEAAGTAVTDKIKDATVAANRIPSNITDALDIDGAAAHRAITGKLFGHAGYLFKESNYQPHLSLYGSVEFTGSDNNALQMWTVGLQGSLNF